MNHTVKKRKTGILGGTFNPPHIAHIEMARAAVETEGMNRVILIPNGDPPHKAVTVSAEDRLNMTRLAADELKDIIGEGRIMVSDIEISRPGYSFLVNTIEQLKQEYPEDELYFIAGGDAVMSIASWYGAKRIFELADVLAFRRAGGIGSDISSALKYLERRGARVHAAKHELPAISSSEIRELIANGSDISEKVPRSVAEYISEKKLYKA